MLNQVIAFFYIAFVGISSALFFCIALVIWLLTVLFDERLVLLHLFSSFWASVYLWAMPAWSVRVKGRNRVRLGEHYVIVSNHQSQLDILLAYRLFFPFKWVSKAEVFKIPFIGWNMYLNRYIKLKRGDKKGIVRMFADCEKALAEGNSLFVFPEGTRSETGSLKPFKAGAFILAKKMAASILPVVIKGTRDALPKHSLNFHGSHKMSISILEPVPYERFANLSAQDTGDMIRDIIAEEFERQEEGEGAGREF
jgi:1-acyl-sn-glycerol-3-phosphate acyltransferase